MKLLLKKMLSLMLAVTMLFSVFCSTPFIANAADTTPKVEIVSFTRGPQNNLRSSELLEARLTGYSGNPQNLTYEWINGLDTYLYVYNSHNMYYINGTQGEIEIHNTKNNLGPLSNTLDRSYDQVYKAKGFCWASVYGAYATGWGEYPLVGTITVNVYDENDNLIATDSHTGSYSFFSGYKGFVGHSLKDDLDDVTIGIFEGDIRNVKDLLGESAIVHITCEESDVSYGNIVGGNEHILLSKDGDYYITGTNAGPTYDSNNQIIKDAEVQLSITKNNCKFHNESSGTAKTSVFVFKKPTTTTTAYSLTLDNLDERCEYYIGGVKGTDIFDQNGKRIAVEFTGLTPNTQYMVEVEAEFYDEKYKQNRYTYAYVYDTTKPIYTGIVEVYLDGKYDSANHSVIGGEKVDVSDVTTYSNLYAKENDSNEYMKLARQEKGKYASILDTGSYNIYYGNDETAQSLVDNQILTMHYADRTRYIFYNSVKYMDGETDLGTEYYLTDSSVTARPAPSEKDGYVFTGWKAVWTDENNTQQSQILKPNEILTSNIATPYVLYAQWEEAVDVYVNITIDHKDEKGAVDEADTMHNVTYDLMTKPQNSSNFEDVLTNEILWDGKSTFDKYGYSVSYKDDKTVYTATIPVAKNVLASSDYTVEIAKTMYEFKPVNVTKEDGKVIIDAQLQWAPTNHDFEFSVRVDEKYTNLPKDILPVAAHVKVLTLYDDPDVIGDENDWSVIVQHEQAFVTVPLDKNWYGEGSYPVWGSTSDGNPYQYRIEIVSYLLSDGTILPAKDGTEIANPHTTQKFTEYCTDDKRYHAKIEVTGVEETDDTKLAGAYFADNNQVGKVEAVISINTHTVIFEPDNGQFTDGTTEIKTVEEQILVPNLDDYTVTRDGGYVFDGWYLVEDGVMTDKTVSSGDDLFNDITLRAKWRDPLTVEGDLYVAAYYHLDGKIIDIPDNDRAYHITVYLQKVLPNGYTETVASQKLEVKYDKSIKTVGVSKYSFTNLPDDGHSYRILVQNPNYIVKHQNEPDSLNSEITRAFDEYYNENNFNAVFDGDKVAVVHTFLEFKPQTFPLNFKVDASSINEGFRPESVEVLVLCNDYAHGNLPQDWAVITQMRNGDENDGVPTAIESNGVSEIHNYPVWKNNTDGHSLYDYAVRLDSYTGKNEDNTDSTIVFDSKTAPFYAFYNGSARFDTLTGTQTTDPLIIELQPRRFAVEFNLNVEDEELSTITNFDKYKVKDGYYETIHIWSYETDISDAKPQRSGYEFLGWYDKDGNKVTDTVAASVAEDIVLTAQWQEIKSYKVTFHANNEYIGYDVFKTYYPSKVVIPQGDFALNSDNTIDEFYEIPEFQYIDHNLFVFKGWYVDTDNDKQPDTPLKFGVDTFEEDTDVYAMWIEAKPVAHAENDKKITLHDGIYPGYDLMGVQIRTAEKDDQEHYGEMGPGLRFVTVLSNDVHNQIWALDSRNASKAEYGYVISKTATVDRFAKADPDHELQYKDKNVNGVDTTKSHIYASNVKCSGVPDHFGSVGYRLYTVVITYKNDNAALVEQAKAQPVSARSYIRYYDVNGLFRTHYNNYIKGDGTNGLYSGCSASYNDALALVKQSK